jgi:predicted aminopeptidase
LRRAAAPAPAGERRARQRAQRARALGLALLLGALPGCYFAQLAGGQLALINRQLPLARALEHEPDPERRSMLAMVPDVRSFGNNVMQLRVGRNYSGYYATEADGIVFVLVASEKTRLSPFTFWFPIVGEVAYKSFFDEASARRAERELAAEGYDTWLGRATAYSTLGFFRDPVTTVMMRKGAVAFVEVLLHEMAHGRMFVPGETDWNEQLASFVGRLGAEQYVRSRYGDDPAMLAELERHLARRARIEQMTSAAVAELEALYARRLPRAAVLRAREPVFAALSSELARLAPEARPWELTVNNARLLQYRRYAAGNAELARLWAQAAGSWTRFWTLCERFIAAGGPLH